MLNLCPLHCNQSLLKFKGPLYNKVKKCTVNFHKFDKKVLTSLRTGQMGFPLITVESTSDNGHKTLKITQEKFNANGSKSSGYLWCVPIIITTASGKSSAFFKHQASH